MSKLLEKKDRQKYDGNVELPFLASIVDEMPGPSLTFTTIKFKKPWCANVPKLLLKTK